MSVPDFYSKLNDRIDTLSEPEQHANLRIGLLVPAAVLSPDPRNTLVTLVERTEAIVRVLVAQDERDYLNELLVAEMIRVEHHFGKDLLGDMVIEKKLEQIQNDDDRQEGYFLLAKSSASKGDRVRALSCAETLDDLYSFEAILRLLIISEQQNSPEETLDGELVEQIESDDGRFRLACALAELFCHRDRLENVEKELAKAKAIFDTIVDPSHRDRLLGDLFTLKLPIALLDSFVPFLTSIPTRCRTLEAHSRVVSNDAPRCLEILRAICDDKTRDRQDADTASTAAALAYRAKDQRIGRDWTRVALGKISENENPTARAALYRALLKTLYAANENKAASRISELLAVTSDQVEPDDLREIEWRENLTLWSLRREEKLLAKYLERIPQSERITVTVIGQLSQGSEPEQAWFDNITLPLWGDNSPEESCSALVKIERLRAQARLENRGSHSIMKGSVVPLFFEPQLFSYS